MLPLLGNWTGLEEHGQHQGAGPTARAMVVFKLDVADQVVVQDYRRVRADGEDYSAHGVFIAAPSDRIQWWFFDSSGRSPVPAAGGWRAGCLVLTHPGEAGVVEHSWAAEPDRLSYHVAVRGADGGLTAQLSGAYRRVSGH